MAWHRTSFGSLAGSASNTAIAQPDFTRNPRAAGVGLLALAKALPPFTPRTWKKLFQAARILRYALRFT
jgi:hypothetical protein